jgi:FkbM family methyltransferase
MELAEFLTNSFWGTVIRSPLRLLPRNADVPILRGPLRGKRWIIGSHRHACWLGIYETALQKLIKQRVVPGSIFYDVGANAGLYTLLAATCVGEGRVIAFEPVPANVASLRKHIGLNHLENVTVFDAAVSDRSGSTSFATGITCADGHISSQGDLQVQTVTLDGLIHEQDVPPPDFIKMDIEGEEFRALQGARECFARFRPELFLATHGKNVHEECCRLLQSWHYEITVLENWEAERATLHATPTAIIGESRSPDIRRN